MNLKGRGWIRHSNADIRAFHAQCFCERATRSIADTNSAARDIAENLKEIALNRHSIVVAANGSPQCDLVACRSRKCQGCRRIVIPDSQIPGTAQAHPL